MITPDYDLFIKILFVVYAMVAIVNIVLGSIGTAKATNYGGNELFSGLVSLGIVLYVMLN